MTLLEDDDRGEHMQMLYPRHAVQNLSTRVSQACELEITTCRLNIFKTLNGTRILVVISLASFARKTWGGECHKDLIVKPEDMSAFRQQNTIDSETVHEEVVQRCAKIPMESHSKLMRSVH